jgi:hypothetical protein
MTTKRRIAAAAAATLISATGAVFFIAGPASANRCSVTPKSGAVSVRGHKSTSGTPDGTLYAGEWLGSACSSESGGYYSACGGGSHWIWVDYGMFPRYVAAGCVRLVVDRVGT